MCANRTVRVSLHFEIVAVNVGETHYTIDLVLQAAREWELLSKLNCSRWLCSKISARDLSIYIWGVDENSRGKPRIWSSSIAQRVIGITEQMLNPLLKPYYFTSLKYIPNYRPSKWSSDKTAASL